ncbi:UNVERIFIED_CONTAM: hypothetical protein GTU68_066791 [Idotea baltica]|nr:hypothetical protein [Idotea baltica]
MGESFGPYTLIDDATLMPYINAVNIACGYHAGDAATMDKTVRLSIEHGLEIGAHPGYPDLQGFGRRAMDINPSTLKSMVLYQVGALQAIARSYGAKLNHVKVHGALYNHASKNKDAAYAIVSAVKSLSNSLIVYVPPHSELLSLATELNVPFRIEAFIDRKYNNDLSLASRKIEGSVITDPAKAHKQLTGMVHHGRISTIDNSSVSLTADTYCIHGDNPVALDILQLIHSKQKND